MAHTGIFATSDEILVKAGANYNTAGGTEARINALCLQIESRINNFCRYNFSDAYSGLNADVKGLLAEAESNLVAMYLILYDMSGYTSVREAEDMLVILADSARKALGTLAEKKTETFMLGA